MGFSKKTRFFFKIANGGKFAAECVSNGIFFSRMFFRSNYEVFWQKTENFERLKIRNYDEDSVFFFEKKRFNLFKSFHYKNGEARNKPVVAGRLVNYLLAGVWNVTNLSRKLIIFMGGCKRSCFFFNGCVDVCKWERHFLRILWRLIFLIGPLTQLKCSL